MDNRAVSMDPEAVGGKQQFCYCGKLRDKRSQAAGAARRPGPSPRQEDLMPTPGVEPRFYTLEDVATILNVRVAQVYALVRSGELPAVKLGGRGVWRVD